MARPRGAGVEHDLDLDGGVAPRVEDLAADDVLDGAHGADTLPVFSGFVESGGFSALQADTGGGGP